MVEASFGTTRWLLHCTFVSGVFRRHDKEDATVVRGRSVEVALQPDFRQHNWWLISKRHQRRQWDMIVFVNDILNSGCWFHHLTVKLYAQALVKRVRKIGLDHRFVQQSHQETQTIFRSLFALPLLPVADIHSTTWSLFLWTICRGRICCRNSYVTLNFSGIWDDVSWQLIPIFNFEITTHASLTPAFSTPAF